MTEIFRNKYIWAFLAQAVQQQLISQLIKQINSVIITAWNKCPCVSMHELTLHQLHIYVHIIPEFTRRNTPITKTASPSNNTFGLHQCKVPYLSYHGDKKLTPRI